MDNVMQLCDIIRQTGFDIHCYHKQGHLEKVYENALAHRLRKLGLPVEQQIPVVVKDEDGTVVGHYTPDLLVAHQLIVEVKAGKAIVDEHIAQLLGYLRGAGLEHGLLVNFGAPKFQIRKFAMSRASGRGPSVASAVVQFVVSALPAFLGGS